WSFGDKRYCKLSDTMLAITITWSSICRLVLICLRRRPPISTLFPYTTLFRSERTFGVMNCDGCHGGGAVGWVGPSLRDGRWRYGGADGDIFQSIYYGQPHGMPAYGGMLPPTAIWKLVTYLQSLEPPANVPTESWR